MQYGSTNLNPINDNDVRTILNFSKNALSGRTKKTDPKVQIIEQTGKSDGSNPIGVIKND